MSKKIFLVVDDDPHCLTHLYQMVERLGHTALKAHDGREALDVLKTQAKLGGILGNAITGIILDYNMPHMDGLEFLHEKNKKWGFKKIPVMMCTSVSQQSDIWEEPLQKGWIQGFLPKPCTMGDLEEQLLKQRAFN